MNRRVGIASPQAILKSATRGGGKEETRWKNDRGKHTTGLVVPKNRVEANMWDHVVGV